MRPVLLTALVLLEVPLGALTTILQLKERERGGGESVLGRKEKLFVLQQSLYAELHSFRMQNS